MLKFILTTLIVSLFISCNNGHTKRTNNDLTNMNLKGSINSIIEKSYSATEKDGKFEKREETPDNSDKLIYTFNTDGNLTEIVGNLFGGSGSTRNEMKYDESGKKNEWIVFNSDGSIQGRSIYKYDKNGYVTEESRYSQVTPAKGDITYQGKIIYKYDDNGNKIEEASYGPDGAKGYIITLKYDSKGYKIQEKDGNHITNYVNDEKGNPIEITLEGKQRYSYVYDEKGNWIVQNIFENSVEGAYIKERKIKYY